MCLCSLGALLVSGCKVVSPQSAFDSPTIVTKEQIRLHALSANPAQGRLLDELVAIRPKLLETIGLTDATNGRLIDIYLFGDETEFREFTSASNALFADRRAFFIKSKEALNVYGFWGMNVEADLRHEVTHGYLHSVAPTIPLWIDEGLAEYFEVSPNGLGVNQPHVQLLSQKYTSGTWQPDLARLESITDPTRLTQTDYAEAWLWTHWLLSTEQGRQIVHARFASATFTAPESWATAVQRKFGDATKVTQHLLRLQNSPTPGGIL